MVSLDKLLAVVLLLHRAALLSGLQLDDLEEASDLGTVVELTDATIEAVLSRHDHILVDFYAPWCKHCQSLSPEVPLLSPCSPPSYFSFTRCCRNLNLGLRIFGNVFLLLFN